MKRNNNTIISIIDNMKIPFNSPVNVLNVYDEISDFCKAHSKNPKQFEWLLIDNMLFVNGNLLAVV